MEAKKLNPNFDDLNKPETIKNHIQELTNKDAKYSELEVKATDVIKPPQIAWEQVVKESRSILGTLGNFSLIIGKAKSRKSFFINIAVSAVLNNDILLSQFRGALPQDKRKVIYFDTEQGKYHVQLALKRICKQIRVDIPEDLVYYLRSEKPSERLKIIEDIIYNTENLGFVVIDGIKDLVTSINDEGEATMIASKLLKWTEEKNIHITTVLHQNKSDNNARGHIGTELINKAETVLAVSKNEQDKDISIVEAQQCRNREPEPFAFEINEDGLPVIVEDFEIRTETKNSKFDITELEDFKKYQLLTEVFSKGDNFNYSELRIQIAYKKQFSKKLGDNRAKELITNCKNKDWLIQGKPKAPYNLGDFKGLEVEDNVF
ncbi:AAA family ATPase [Psychroflexus sp. MES1-P1E]|uniref:AAA family ATPase n=1 Tax=Psychroflexus sp. MES1-P1E TaxID=2058320 RepID=UPI000C7B9C76|nr:AAA family ATPase [Psychroflexus sp. MES1-P1E]PKG44053.1 mobilization protein [Psychroflexus sp. MES1-P1E]